MVGSNDDTTGDLTVQVDWDKRGPFDDGGARPSLTVLTGYDAGRIHVLDSLETLVGRADECDIQVLEPTVSRKHARFIATTDGVEVFDLRSSNGVTINGHRVQRQWLKEQDVVGLGGKTSFKFAYVTESDFRYQEQLFDNAVHDSLTRLYNKRYFLGVLGQHLLTARKKLDALTLMMLDLDHFKEINDTHGHQVGDAVLRHVSTLVRQESRNNDVIGRYGGEEFIILLTDVDAESAVRIAERMRKTIHQNMLNINNLHVKLTASIGVATAVEAEGSADDLIALADERLYVAKRRGRNRVCFTSSNGDLNSAYK